MVVVVVSWVEWNLNLHPFKNQGCGTQRPDRVAASNCGLTGGRGFQQPCREYSGDLELTE